MSSAFTCGVGARIDFISELYNIRPSTDKIPNPNRTTTTATRTLGPVGRWDPSLVATVWETTERLLATRLAPRCTLALLIYGRSSHAPVGEVLSWVGDLLDASCGSEILRFTMCNGWERLHVYCNAFTMVLPSMTRG